MAKMCGILSVAAAVSVCLTGCGGGCTILKYNEEVAKDTAAIEKCNKDHPPKEGDLDSIIKNQECSCPPTKNALSIAKKYLEDANCKEMENRDLLVLAKDTFELVAKSCDALPCTKAQMEYGKEAEPHALAECAKNHKDDLAKWADCSCPHLKTVVPKIDKYIAGACKDADFQKRLADDKEAYKGTKETLKCPAAVVEE